jgi:hypothetical protein
LRLVHPQVDGQSQPDAPWLVSYADIAWLAGWKRGEVPRRRFQAAAKRLGVGWHTWFNRRGVFYPEEALEVVKEVAGKFDSSPHVDYPYVEANVLSAGADLADGYPSHTLSRLIHGDPDWGDSARLFRLRRGNEDGWIVAPEHPCMNLYPWIKSGTLVFRRDAIEELEKAGYIVE